MPSDDQVWVEYYERIRARRQAERPIIVEQLEAAGVTEASIVVLDFTFFSNTTEAADKVISELSENYQLEASEDVESGYWLVRGTTRPYGVNVNPERYEDWVSFMLEVGFSHGAIFSTWSVTDTESGASWSTEEIETDDD